MAFVQFSKVSLAFGDRDILKEVSINLSSGTKAALAGSNGSGKTTLMKVLAGITPNDTGDRAVQKNTRIGYLPQAGIVHKGCTLRKEADRAFQYGYDLQDEMDGIGDELAKNPDKSKNLLERYHEIQQCLEQSSWYRRETLAEQILLGLGFEHKDLERNVEEFSGGWQMRIALAKILLENPDILLLDEPTNYLDLEARNWLEQFLKDFTGGFLLVSHDRYFLDVTINEVYELFDGTLRRFPGNYTHYEKVREVELESLLARFAVQQDEIKKLEDFIRRFGAKATKASQAQERQKQLDKIDRIVIPESLKKIHFTFPSCPHSGRLVVRTEELCKTYHTEGYDNAVIKDLDLIVEKGERLVIAGRNGAGKTTLLRIIAGEDLDYEGTVKLGSGVSIGYFSQDNAEKIKGSQSMLDLLESESPLELIPRLRDMLGSFLFRGDDVHKSLDVLSGGEKSRLALLRILLRPVNLLILDEPTNHLDLHSKDVLLKALEGFGGTVLFVSHDRGFIESLATRVLELSSGRHRIFPGNYYYYLERLEDEKNGIISSPLSIKQADYSKDSNTSETQASENQLSWEEDKKLKAEKRRLEKEESRLMELISTLEEKKVELEHSLAQSEVYSDGEKCRKVQADLDETEKLIISATEEWAVVSEKISE